MIRALIVIEVPFYREGLGELLAKSGEVEVVGAVSDPDDAERVAGSTLPDVVLLDIGTPGAAESLRRLRRVEPPPRIVALAVRETPEGILQWVESGITAYVPRDAKLGDLIRVLHGAVHDELYCSPRIAATMLRRLALLAQSSRHRERRVEALSAREQEVLSLLAKGLSNKAIASRLGIANATAKNHVHNILDKLQLRRRVEAATLAQRDQASPR